MDFFERQDQARRNTKLLVVYFILGVALLIVAVYAATLVIFTGVASRHHHLYDGQAQLVLWNPQLFLGAAVGTLAVIALGSGFKTMELAQGGSTVATMLGGRLVDPATTDPDERKLRNVVEEMAIAAGVPVPQVYLLPEESAINAFAAGHSTSDAVVAVTGGAMKLLTRDELQGVIGHEFSHILNGDMRLNLRLMGVIFGILCLAVIGRMLFYTRSRSRRKESPSVTGPCAVADWLDRRLLWPPHSGGGQPPARVSGRRLVGAVHPQPGGAGRRAQEDRRPELRLEARRRRMPKKPATCSSATAWANRSST